MYWKIKACTDELKKYLINQQYPYKLVEELRKPVNLTEKN